MKKIDLVFSFILDCEDGTHLLGAYWKSDICCPQFIYPQPKDT
jgi:hypothetical protein